MIVKMKKIWLLCAASAQQRTLEALREMGVVHLNHVVFPEGEELEKARNTLKYVQRVLDELPENADALPSGGSAHEVIERVWGLIREREDLEEELESMRSEYARIEPFGSFQPALIEELQSHGIYVTLYRAGPEYVPAAPQGAVVHELKRDRSGVCFVVIHREAVDLPVRQVRVPEKSLNQLAEAISETEQSLEHNARRMNRYVGDRNLVLDIVDEVNDRIRYIEAHRGMGAEGPVVYVRGYLPENSVSAIEGAAAAHGWGYRIEEPAPDEQPPTYITNPSWVNLIKPVFDFMGIVPGYREVDISACFLFFFSIFFGMIVGDAGYGFIFLALTLGFRKKLGALSPYSVPLMVLMSICTMVWGVLTGTYFSMNAAAIGPLSSVKVNWLTEHDNLMLLCFLLGASHLTLAHGWSALRMMNSPQALAQVGWICNTWAMFFVVNAMVLGAPFPPFLLPLFITGVVLIAAFMTPLKKLKAEAFNHVMLPLDLISNFVDVISYVRLFAVGLATYAVGNAFNGMALGDGVNGFVAGLGAALVLFLGHTLNIVMAAMSVLVHGIRLNTLEFSGHLGMEWSGFPYEPFKRTFKEE